MRLYRVRINGFHPAFETDTISYEYMLELLAYHYGNISPRMKGNLAELNIGSEQQVYKLWVKRVK